MDRTIAFLLWVIVLFPSGAMAACGGLIAGPVGKNSAYYYSSSCFNRPSGMVRLNHRVCSVSQSTVVFKWTKLNWVSGSSGVEFGGCLVRESDYFSVIRVAGSLITANVGVPYNTEVYVPDLKQGNSAYYDSVEGGGPRIDGGTSKERFRFEVRYFPTADKKTVQIRATMAGERPVFYVVLPRSIKKSEDLTKFITDDSIQRITPLLEFSDKALTARTKDTVLAEFYKENEIATRAVLVVQGEKDSASLEFTALGTLPELLPDLAICVGQAEMIASCFQAGMRPQ
jgi:hypothetical protein